MPWKARSPCNVGGCPEITRGRFCDKHAKQSRRHSERGRATPAERGYGRQWQRARDAYLSRGENAQCVVCAAAGWAIAASVVDHIMPHNGDPVLMWDEGNWQSLCSSCHGRKTALHDGGFGRAITGATKQ